MINIPLTLRIQWIFDHDNPQLINNNQILFNNTNKPILWSGEINRIPFFLLQKFLSTNFINQKVRRFIEIYINDFLHNQFNR